MKLDPSPPGDPIYLSERKLRNLAIYYGVKTSGRGDRAEVEAGAGVKAGLPKLGELSAQRTVRSERRDPAASQRATVELLDRVVERLGGERLPSLETAEGEIREADWFRFHRALRFGIAHADAVESMRALVLADEKPVPQGLSIPGLLMTGAVAHVLDPYATDELRNAPGSRSGSGTDHLFVWLDRTREALESDIEAKLDEVDLAPLRFDGPPRDPGVALDMYSLFAEERWMDLSAVPPLLRAAPCEGVAQASFIAVTEELTLVMGSPLYVRVRALPKSPWESAPLLARRRGGFLRRAWRRVRP